LSNAKRFAQRATLDAIAALVSKSAGLLTCLEYLDANEMLLIQTHGLNMLPVLHPIHICRGLDKFERHTIWISLFIGMNLRASAFVFDPCS
jgi:hypothetical protein